MKQPKWGRWQIKRTMKILGLFEKLAKMAVKLFMVVSPLQVLGILCLQPLFEASPNDVLMKEETFGPIGTFLSYDDEEELIEMMNSTHLV